MRGRTGAPSASLLLVLALALRVEGVRVLARSSLLLSFPDSREVTVEGVAAFPLPKGETPRQRFLLWGSRIFATLDNTTALESVVISLDFTEVFPRLCKVCALVCAVVTPIICSSKAPAIDRVPRYRVMRRRTFTCGGHRQRTQRPRKKVPVDALPVAYVARS